MKNEKKVSIFTREPGPGTFGGRSSRALSISALMDISNYRAIDLGSHEGHNSFDLHECGCRDVLGLEARQRFVSRAEEERDKLGYNAVRFMAGDVRKIDEMEIGQFDLCLCSGLLYHMQNPFNVLKRIRNVCRYLVLETHIAPSIFNWFRCTPNYRKNLTWRMHKIVLDQQVFRGRLNVFPEEQDMQKTSGSVVSRATFWLTKESLLRALELAGFRVNAVYFEPYPKDQPDILVQYGYPKTKIFIFAEVKEPSVRIEAGEGIVGHAMLK